MRILHEIDHGWEYLLTLAGSELPKFPLREMEEIIRARLRGSSSLQSFEFPKKELTRVSFRHELREQ